MERLSYFTSTDVPAGTMVVVPLRKKSIRAIVVQSEDVSTAKSEIKSSTFSLRKMEHVEAHQFLSPEFMASAEAIADYFATTTGSVLGAMIPKAILDPAAELISELPDTVVRPHTSEQLVLQADDEERFSDYKSLIREEFARGFSVFLCVPTIEDAKRARGALEKGIEQYTFLLHSSLKKKDVAVAWNGALQQSHPVLIIATAQFLCIPKKNIGTIIIEKEGSRAYKTQTRPFLDARTCASIYAKKIRARLLMGDTLLRTETMWRLKNDELVEYSPLKFRSATSASAIIVDTRKEPTSEDQKKEVAFSTLSPELGKLIEWNKERSEHMFIFGVRKGFAPLTVCGDCGTVARCTVCSAPVVLHSGIGENYFECHTCGKRRGAKETCSVCKSWKLVTLGVGVELIEKELKQKFPDVTTFRLDAHSVTTHAKAVDVVKKFYATPGSVLIGTEMALSYLGERIENSAIASIDPLFSLPDFRIGEKILSILLKIRALTKENFVIQTRDPEHAIFTHAIKGNLVDFYRDEIEERKTFGYPPFFIFIKITLQGEERAVRSAIEELPPLFEPYHTDIYPAFTSTVKGKYVMHALIKIPHGEWPNKEVVASLRSLPPQYMVKVDPDSML